MNLFWKLWIIKFYPFQAFSSHFPTAFPRPCLKTLVYASATRCYAVPFHPNLPRLQCLSFPSLHRFRVSSWHSPPTSNILSPSSSPHKSSPKIATWTWQLTKWGSKLVQQKRVMFSRELLSERGEQGVIPTHLRAVNCINPLVCSDVCKPDFWPGWPNFWREWRMMGSGCYQCWLSRVWTWCDMWCVGKELSKFIFLRIFLRNFFEATINFKFSKKIL